MRMTAGDGVCGGVCGSVACCSGVCGAGACGEGACGGVCWADNRSVRTQDKESNARTMRRVFVMSRTKILRDQFARQCKRRVGPGIDNVLSGATSVISAKRIAQLQAWYPRCDTSHRARTGYGNCRMNSNAMVACSALLQHLHSVLCSLYTVLPIAEFFEQWVLRPMRRISTRPTLRTVG